MLSRFLKHAHTRCAARVATRAEFYNGAAMNNAQAFARLSQPAVANFNDSASMLVRSSLLTQGNSIRMFNTDGGE